MTTTNIILLVIIGVLLLFLYISFKAGARVFAKYNVSRDVTIKILNTVKSFINDFNANHKDIKLDLKFIGKVDKIIELTEQPITIRDFNTMDGEISIVKVKINQEDVPQYMYMIENKNGVILISDNLSSICFKSIDKAAKGLAELSRIKTLIKIK